MNDKKDVIARVQQMEQYMDEVAQALQNAPDKLKNNDELCNKIAVLTDYMDSGQWLADYEADERGELPKDLKRGVLSQDGLYNLICDVEELWRETVTLDFPEEELKKAYTEKFERNMTRWKA